jgi:hypothetical protein
VDAVAALLHGWLIVLAVAGATKMLEPRDAVDALASLGVRVPDAVGRTAGVVELTVAAVAFAWAGRGPAALVVMVTAGIAVVAFALAMSPLAVPCGCVGRRDTTVGPVHVTVVIGALVIAVGAVVRGVDDVIGSLDGDAGAVVAHLSIALGTAAVVTLGLLGRPARAAQPGTVR